MKLVYICSPLRGDIDANMEKAREYCMDAVDKGVTPIAPHLFFTQFLSDDIPQEREQGMSMGMELLSRCDELWVYGSRISEGMAQEIAFAESIGKSVLYLQNIERDEKNETIRQNNGNGGAPLCVSDEPSGSVCIISY